MAERNAHEEAGPISHDEAESIALAYIDHAFGNPEKLGRRVRHCIPANPREDTDIRLMAYIKQQRAKDDESRGSASRPSDDGATWDALWSWEFADWKRKISVVEINEDEGGGVSIRADEGGGVGTGPFHYGEADAATGAARILCRSLGLDVPAASRPGPSDGDGREVWVAFDEDNLAFMVGETYEQVYAEVTKNDRVERYVPASLASTPASAEGAGGWVACEERMPEPGQWVLAHRPGHHMRMFSHTGWGWRKEDGTKPSHALEYTHWVPLPAPPAPPKGGET